MMNLHSAALVASEEQRAESTSLRERLAATRALSFELASPLSDEDQVVQAMDDASPTKWHLAHTTGSRGVRDERFLAGYGVFEERFEYASIPIRERRRKASASETRLRTRPAAEEVSAYRARSMRRSEPVDPRSRRRRST